MRQIVEMHGGTVTAESVGENGGATFTVQLPVMQQSSALPPDPVQPLVSIENPLSGWHILVVDDDDDTREFQSFVLEQNGARMTSVSSGMEALQTLQRFMPNALVSDIGMADMDGYMLIQQIRSLNQGAEIPAGASLLPKAIALTAYAAEIDQQKALKSGFQNHLTKPIDPDALVAALIHLLTDRFS